MAGLDLFSLCETVLDYAVLSLDSLPEEDPDLLGAPTRRFVAPGLPEIECCGKSPSVQGQLSVHVEQFTEEVTSPITPTPGENQRTQIGWLNKPVIIVMLARCSPVGTLRSPPTAEQWTASARQVQSDGWALWEGLHYAQRSDAAFAAVCDGMTFQPAQGLAPEGGCVGWVFPLLPILQGYNPLDPPGS